MCLQPTVKGNANKKPEHPGGHLTSNRQSQVQPLAGPRPRCQTIWTGNYPRSSVSSGKGWFAIGLAKFRDTNTKKKVGVSYHPGD